MACHVAGAVCAERVDVSHAAPQGHASTVTSTVTRTIRVNRGREPSDRYRRGAGLPPGRGRAGGGDRWSRMVGAPPECGESARRRRPERSRGAVDARAHGPRRECGPAPTATGPGTSRKGCPIRDVRVTAPRRHWSAQRAVCRFICPSLSPAARRSRVRSWESSR